MQLKRRQISGDGPGARGFPAAALLGLGAAAAVCGNKAESERRIVPLLDPADLSTWTTWRFVGETRYALVEKDVRYVDAVAFMTDTDNPGGRTVGFYAGIYFAER